MMERETQKLQRTFWLQDSLLAARLNEADIVHNSACSTPIKTPFGTPSQLQTPTSKLFFLSANKKNQSVGAGGCGVNEDASITRTPFRLLAGKNLNAYLFSPSKTPRPVGFPAPLDKLASPSLEGRAKRVLVMPPQLPAARRVPVRQNRTPAGKQSPFATPKSSRIDNVQSVTPKSRRIDNVSRASGRKDNDTGMEHHNMHTVDVNDDKNKERCVRPKRVAASTPQQSPFATPNSIRAEYLFKTAGQSDAPSGGKLMPHEDANVKHGRAKLDRSELLIRALASMPQLSSQARRVPLRKKQKQPIEIPPPPHHKEKQQPSIKKATSENPKTTKSGQGRKQTCQNEAGALDGKRQSATQKPLKRAVPKGKGGNGVDKTKKQSVNNHTIKGGSSKHQDDGINKKCGDNPVNDKASDVNQYCEDGKQHEACDVDVGRNEYHDVGNDAKQHHDDDGTKRPADDVGENDKRQSVKGRDDKQHEDRCVNVSGGDETKEHYGDGSECRSDANGTEQHDYHNGNDDDIGVKSNDEDGEMQHGHGDTAKQHNYADVVKMLHNDDGRTQYNDDDGDDNVEISGEDAMLKPYL